MKRSARRAAVATLSQASALGLLASLVPGLALAQGGTGEGFEFKSVKPAAPVDAAAGKIEVVEFFWYGCPHCYGLEPALKEWVKRLPTDVSFRKVHVPWQVQAHQQLYFTLESMGLAESMGDKVFAAIHTDRNKLDTPESMADLLARNGVDRKQFLDAYASFGVRTKVQRARELAAAYKIDGVPTFGVAGRFVTSPAMMGSNGAALKMVETLVDRVRKGA